LHKRPHRTPTRRPQRPQARHQGHARIERAQVAEPFERGVHARDLGAPRAKGHRVAQCLALVPFCGRQFGLGEVIRPLDPMPGPVVACLTRRCDPRQTIEGAKGLDEADRYMVRRPQRRRRHLRLA
jgi:hypothetical protein